MIRPPRRSVTRFFIPMIDVLTLLFCIFLLMPFVKTAGKEGVEGGSTTQPSAESMSDPVEVKRQIQELEKELERLRKTKADIASRLLVRTLELRNGNAELYYYDPDEAVIASKEDAAGLIARDRETARKSGGRELYYLVLRPHDPKSGALPTRSQQEFFKKWFEGVSYSYDK